MLNQRCINGPNPHVFGHGGLGGSFAFVDLEHRIGFGYVSNRFDASKANADPRSVALSNEVYAVLGVRADFSDRDEGASHFGSGAHPRRSSV
jgi:CubicO group peptidase (beta-lactamase class C family)